MLLVNDDNLRINFLGHTGLVTFEENNNIYLCDSRTHIFSLFFPPITFIVPLKGYKICGTFKADNKKIPKVAIPWGLLFFGAIVGTNLGNINITTSVELNRMVMLIGAFLIFILKYFFHFYNLKQFEKRNGIQLSKTKVLKLSMKYVNKSDQKSYYLFLIKGCLFYILFDLFFWSYCFFYRKSTGNIRIFYGMDITHVSGEYHKNWKR